MQIHEITHTYILHSRSFHFILEGGGQLDSHVPSVFKTLIICISNLVKQVLYSLFIFDIFKYCTT